MGAFLADSGEGEDSELVFRACYEMSAARYHYAEDDVAHRDLLECLDEQGRLLAFVEAAVGKTFHNCAQHRRWPGRPAPERRFF